MVKDSIALKSPRKDMEVLTMNATEDNKIDENWICGVTRLKIVACTAGRLAISAKCNESYYRSSWKWIISIDTIDSSAAN